MERIEWFYTVSISQFTFPYSNISKFSSLLDIWKRSLWNQLDVRQTAMTTSLPFPGPKTFPLSRLLYLVRLSWRFKMEQMHSRQKNKNSAAHSSSGKQLGIDLILPLFSVSELHSAVTPSLTRALELLPQCVWDHGILFLFFAFCWLQVPTSCYLQGKDFGLQMFLHVLTTSIWVFPNWGPGTLHVLSTSSLMLEIPVHMLFLTPWSSLINFSRTHSSKVKTHP